MIDLGGGRYRLSKWLVSGVVAGLACSLALGGCGSDDSDEPPDSGLPSSDKVTTSPTTASPTNTPTETTPTEPSPPTSMPAAATKPGRGGAQAFVKFYVGLENYAKDTGNVAPLRRYSHPQCGGCNDLIRFYQDWYQRGGWFKGGDREIRTFVRVVPAVAPHDMYVRLNGRTEPSTYRRNQSAKTLPTRGSNFTLLFWLLREQDGWRVSRLDTPS
jgi:hypothetical protein